MISKISSIDAFIHELFLEEDDDKVIFNIFQLDLNSVYFLEVNMPGWAPTYTYLIAYKVVSKLLKTKIIDPEISEDEFKVQFALGTINRRNYKINKEMIRKYVAENKIEN